MDVHENLYNEGEYVYMGQDDKGADMFADSSEPSKLVYSKLDDRERAFLKEGDEYKIPEINKLENGKHIVTGMNGGLIKTFCAEDGKEHIFDKAAFGADSFKIKTNEPFEIAKSPSGGIGLKFDNVFDRNKNEDIESSFRRMGFNPVNKCEESTGLPDPLNVSILNAPPDAGNVRSAVNSKFHLNFNGKDDLKMNKITPDLNIFEGANPAVPNKELEKTETGRTFKNFTSVDFNGESHIPKKSTADEYYVFDKTDKYVVFGKVKPAAENDKKPTIEYFKTDLNGKNISSTLKYQLKGLKKLDMVNFKTGDVTHNYADVNAKRIFADAHSDSYKKLYKLEKSSKNMDRVKSAAGQIKSISVSLQNLLNNVKHEHLKGLTNGGNALRI
jgi:hypothetical protein